MGVFLDGCSGDLLRTPVVTKVDDLAALALQDPPKDAYRRVMPIEDGGSGHHAQRYCAARGPREAPRCGILGTAHHDSPTPRAHKNALPGNFRLQGHFRDTVQGMLRLRHEAVVV
mgnify:CR=1 FL=1